MASLNDFPSELLLSIFQKVQPTTLCRLRQTTRKMDEIAERERFYIQNRSDSEEWVLRIQVHGITKPKIRISVFKGQLDMSNPYSSTFNPRSSQKKGRIEDVYKQLSAFKFNTVIVKFNFRGGLLHESIPNCLTRQKKFFHEEMLPLIRNLRLECERLCLENVFPAEVCPLIRFSRLHTRSVPVSVEDYQKWPVWKNCLEHDLESLSLRGPVPLSPLVRNLSTSRLSFTLHSKNYSFSMLKQFLTECKTDASVRGKLEHLFLEASFRQEDNIDQIPGAIHLWSGIPYDYSPPSEFNQNVINISKVLIEGGVAIIIRQYYNYNVFFFNDYTRSTLLNLIFPWMFSQVPFDLSPLFDDFEASENDETAVVRLYFSYKGIYEKWQIAYLRRLEEMYEEEEDAEMDLYVTRMTKERSRDSDDDDDEWGGDFLSHQFVYL